jgi:hyperosmotically inducible periplasmic protein
MRFNYLLAGLAMGVMILSTGSMVQASETDERIEASAKNSYVFKTYLKDDAVKTYSKDGVVTLKGTVKEYSHRSLAQETVENLPGVKSVDNQIEFKGEAPPENSDGWISMKVKGALLFNRNVSGVKTEVYVTDGVVTLKGEADSQAQKDLTGEYAKDVQGVKEVKNELVVSKVEYKTKETMGDKIDDASITAQVKMAFLSHHSTSAFKTGVETNNGVVTLSGNAVNSAAKDMATKVANNINGVTSVVNNMIIAVPTK